MYQISNYSGKVRNAETGEIFNQDDTLPQWLIVHEWRVNGGVFEFIDFFESEEVEIESKNALQSETKKYLKRTEDGRNAYAEISAEFRLAKLNGIISEETHSVIEKTLIPVRNEVLAGQWISAKNELVLISSAVIGVQLYDRLFNQITNYINLNY